MDTVTINKVNVETAYKLLTTEGSLTATSKRVLKKQIKSLVNKVLNSLDAEVRFKYSTKLLQNTKYTINAEQTQTLNTVVAGGVKKELPSDDVLAKMVEAELSNKFGFVPEHLNDKELIQFALNFKY